MQQVVLKVEYGALLEVPIYESHWRGKNWMAEIWIDPKAPGGLGRRFFQKANGEYYYIIDRAKAPMAIEFGADYYSGSGKKSPKRWYGVIIRVTTEELVLEEYDTARQAINAAKEKQQGNEQATIIRKISVEQIQQ
jgi:hypothetical protein